jgi:hypothetical protein
MLSREQNPEHFALAQCRLRAATEVDSSNLPACRRHRLWPPETGSQMQPGQ